MLLESITDVQLVSPPARNQSEMVCFPHVHSKAVKKSLQNTYDNDQNIFQAAEIVRREILAEEKWQFNGSYDGFSILKSLELLLHWLLCGSRKDSETRAKRNEIEKSVNILSEFVMNIIKGNRQLQYNSHRSNDRVFNQMSEIPLTVGLGIHLYKSRRSKYLVHFIFDLSWCISYDKIMQIEKCTASSVTQRIKENNRMYIPSNIFRGVPIHFSINNCDFKNDTPDGKNEFRGTAQVVILY